MIKLATQQDVIEAYEEIRTYEKSCVSTVRSFGSEHHAATRMVAEHTDIMLEGYMSGAQASITAELIFDAARERNKKAMRAAGFTA